MLAVLKIADFWSGLGSAIVGGVAGALTVVLGASLAYWYGERSRRNDRRHQDERAAEDARRAAAAQLMVEVSNLRDAICSRTKGLGGTAELWPMRNALFTTHVPLRDYPSYDVVHGFYETAYAWREWVRCTQSFASGPEGVRAHFPIVDDYQKALKTYGDEVIQVLQTRLEQRPLNAKAPELPPLPPPVNR